MNTGLPPPPEEAPCDHDWVFMDESFDHEFGCQQVYYWKCALCEATRDLAPGDFCEDD